MWMQLIWEWLETAVFPLPSTGGERPLFNFYRDEHPALDCPQAAQLRRENLRRSLERFSAPPRRLVVGEAPGWRGGRFSGAPFTSEALLLSGRLGYTGVATSRQARPLAEASATLFWQALEGNPDRCGGVLAWNCLPFHPHQPGDPCSNRRPTPAELDAYRPLLVELIGLAQPEQVIAVGGCAQRTLQKAGIPAVAVRHPSHGGAAAFQAQLKQALESVGDGL